MKNLKNLTACVLAVIFAVLSLAACTDSARLTDNGPSGEVFLYESTESTNTALTGDADFTSVMTYTTRGLSPMLVASMNEEVLTQKMSSSTVSY